MIAHTYTELLAYRLHSRLLDALPGASLSVVAGDRWLTVFVSDAALLPRVREVAIVMTAAYSVVYAP